MAKKSPPAQAPAQEAPSAAIGGPITVRYQDAAGVAKSIEVAHDEHGAGPRSVDVLGGRVVMSWGETFPEALLSAKFEATEPASEGAQPASPEAKAPPPTGRFLVIDVSSLMEADATEAAARIARNEGASVAVVGGEPPAKARDMGALMMVLERLAPLAKDRFAAVKNALGAKLGTEKELHLSDGRVVTGRRALGKAVHPWTVVEATQRSMLEDD